MTSGAEADLTGAERAEGAVVKLDRGYPLVRLSDSSLLRCEHSTALVKGDRSRAVIGDRVLVSLPEGHDKGIIEEILPRSTRFVRRDPAQRTASQVLAANFSLVIVAEPIAQLNFKRLERELVLAHETGAKVAVVLTKTDLMGEEADRVVADAKALAGAAVEVVATSLRDAASLERARALVGPGEVAILVGKSGVGKSSLLNALAGRDVQDTAAVRARDGKGRHTTVDRVMVSLPGGGSLVDMPGMRGLGLWDAEAGLRAAFSDIERLARDCRFRDCSHRGEPGCAVTAAVQRGDISQARLDSYLSLTEEMANVQARREEASHLKGEKASDRKRKRA